MNQKKKVGSEREGKVKENEIAKEDGERGKEREEKYKII